jgi:hypothetical protein
LLAAPYLATYAETMDNPDHEHKSIAEPFQDPLCPALEHEDQLSIQPEKEIAEQWLVSMSRETATLC